MSPPPMIVQFGASPWRAETPERLDIPPRDLGFSRDGKLAFRTAQSVQGTSFQAKLLVTRASGGAPLYTLDVPYGMRAPQFTPDGKAVAFMLTRNRATNIWQQPLAGGEPIQVTKFLSGEMFAFAWSRDGKQLAFSRGQRNTDVVMMNNFH